MLVFCLLFPSTLHAEPPSKLVLRDVTAESGVDFQFKTGTRGRHDLPEIMGGGVALIDGDGDGRPDLFFCNGGPIDNQVVDDSPCRYYRNNGNGTFIDATATAHAPGPSYAMGATVGDFDGDGRDDLFVTGWRDQRLYRNEGNGRFNDVTERAGLRSNLWSTSAAWADLDGDGDLDLYVASYLDFSPRSAPFCAAPDGHRDYCGPEDFPAQPDRLYRNNGDGTFTDVSRSAGIDLPEGRGLGVIVADLIGDARPDIFVANDGTPAWLFENLGGLRFREVAQQAGIAVDGNGQALAGMGVSVGDIDGDGRCDLAVSNFYGRNTLGYRSLEAGRFLDVSATLGLTAATRSVNGFGLALVDFDGDGRLDLAQTNGHVLDRARLGVPFAMRPTLLRNVGETFASTSALPWSTRVVLGRGLAVGDLDGDGRPDLVTTALDASPSILLNRSPGRSVSVELVAGRKRTAFGARIRATIAGRTIVRELPGGGSYLSASERRVFFGLGDARRMDRIEVVWPGGQTESWTDLPASTHLHLEAGTGRR